MLQRNTKKAQRARHTAHSRSFVDNLAENAENSEFDNGLDKDPKSGLCEIPKTLLGTAVHPERSAAATFFVTRPGPGALRV